MSNEPITIDKLNQPYLKTSQTGEQLICYTSDRSALLYELGYVALNGEHQYYDAPILRVELPYDVEIRCD